MLLRSIRSVAESGALAATFRATDLGVDFGEFRARVLNAGCISGDVLAAVVVVVKMRTSPHDTGLRQ